MVEPILKWAGGKRQLLSEITGIFPERYNHYHEPFVGGGAVFFHLQPANGSINDLNSRLVNFYRIVRDHPKELIDENKRHENTEDYFYDARDEFNRLHKNGEKDKEEKIKEASLLLYLNRTCFNGLYRENSDGEFNVPIGNYTNPDFIQRERIKAASEALQETNICNEDFNYVSEVAEEGDLVYFDPPYEPVSKTANFNDYHADGFGKEDQKRLRDIAVELAKDGIYVVLSNSPPVAELYKNYHDFHVNHVQAVRAINSDGDNRGEVSEVLISNIPQKERRRKTLTEFGLE